MQSIEKSLFFSAYFFFDPPFGGSGFAGPPVNYNIVTFLYNVAKKSQRCDLLPA